MTEGDGPREIGRLGAGRLRGEDRVSQALVLASGEIHHHCPLVRVGGAASSIASSHTWCNTIGMKERPFWKETIEEAWTRKGVVWLRGVRRVGKTTLAQSLDRVRYFDCELPGVRRRIESPESFLRHNRGARIVLDEIHRLPNPSEILKIAADHFPETRVLATGSSTLGASARFRDTLAGRKADRFSRRKSSRTSFAQ